MVKTHLINVQSRFRSLGKIRESQSLTTVTSTTDKVVGHRDSLVIIVFEDSLTSSVDPLIFYSVFRDSKTQESIVFLSATGLLYEKTPIPEVSRDLSNPESRHTYITRVTCENLKKFFGVKFVQIVQFDIFLYLL